ncbi:hypothetical protein Trydic_g10814 [Trypoxylus dichotomus]
MQHAGMVRTAPGSGFRTRRTMGDGLTGFRSNGGVSIKNQPSDGDVADVELPQLGSENLPARRLGVGPGRCRMIDGSFLYREFSARRYLELLSDPTYYVRKRRWGGGRERGRQPLSALTAAIYTKRMVLIEDTWVIRRGFTEIRALLRREMEMLLMDLLLKGRFAKAQYSRATCGCERAVQFGAVSQVVAKTYIHKQTGRIVAAILDPLTISVRGGTLAISEPNSRTTYIPLRTYGIYHQVMIGAGKVAESGNSKFNRVAEKIEGVSDLISGVVIVSVGLGEV